MKLRLLALSSLIGVCATAQPSDNLVLEGVPSIPPSLRLEVGPYLESRAAIFRSWHPTRHEVLITTRFAETAQLYEVRRAGGARRQLTFSTEPVAGAEYRPRAGDFIVFAQDTGGGEFYQLYRYDLANGRITLLTDGRSRNTGMKWSHSGQWLAFTSTRRNGKDNDLYLMDPSDPKSTRLLLQVSGGGWAIEDWSREDSQLVVSEFISINESRLHLVDVKSGARSLLTPAGDKEKVSYAQARFAGDGRTIYITTDKNSEFQQLAKLDLQIAKKNADVPFLATIQFLQEHLLR